MGRALARTLSQSSRVFMVIALACKEGEEADTILAFYPLEVGLNEHAVFAGCIQALRTFISVFKKASIFSRPSVPDYGKWNLSRCWLCYIKQ